MKFIYDEDVLMYRYVLKRLLWMIPIVLSVAILIFTIMYFVPGDVAKMILGPNASAQALEAKRIQLGLDQPFFVRLGIYLSDVFLHFDFGKSVIDGSSITESLLSRFPRTFMLALIAMVLSIVIGTPLGIVSALNQNKWQDQISMFVALVGISMPGFWLGLLLVLLFSLTLHWLPSSGIGGIEYYILPGITNAFVGIAIQARQTRSALLEVIRSDYISTARAKGVSERKVLYKHMLPNASIPVVTALGMSFGFQMAGTVIIENVFAIPGIGQYTVNAISFRDYNAVQGSVIILAITFSLVMLIVDILYAYLDPRIKAQFEGKKRKKANA